MSFEDFADYDGTASTDASINDMGRADPRTVAIVARLQIALEKLDSALLETRSYLDGGCDDERDRVIVQLLKHACAITMTLYETLPASREEVQTNLKRKPRKPLPVVVDIGVNVQSKVRVERRRVAIGWANKALLNMHYLLLKLRGHPTPNTRRLLAIAVIARDLQTLLFDDWRNQSELGHEGTESVEGTEDLSHGSEDAARRFGVSQSESVRQMLAKLRTIVTFLQQAARTRLSEREAGSLTKPVRSVRKALEAYMCMIGIDRLRLRGGGTANRRLEQSLNQINFDASALYDWLLASPQCNEAQRLQAVEFLGECTLQLQFVRNKVVRRRRPSSSKRQTYKGSPPRIKLSDIGENHDDSSASTTNTNSTNTSTSQKEGLEFKSSEGVL